MTWVRDLMIGRDDRGLDGSYEATVDSLADLADRRREFRCSPCECGGQCQDCDPGDVEDKR